MNSQVPSAPPQRLPRILGPWMATSVVIGTMIGSGVFKKASSVSDNVTEFGLVMSAWALVGLLTAMGAMALAEVAVLLPRAGGNYVFLKESYGRWAGFLWGWVEFWIIRAGSIAALATIFAESVHDILRLMRGGESDVLSHWARAAMTVVVIAVLAVVNSRGTRLGGGLQVVVTSVKVVTLMGVALLPFIVMSLVNEPAARPSVADWSPAWPTDWSSVDWSRFGGALIGIYFAYNGWTNIAPVAEEVTNPHRNLPLALFVGVFTVTILYLAVNAAYYLIIPRAEIVALKERTVVGEFAFRLLGPIGLALASTAVMVSVFGAINGSLMAGSRLLFAVGRDGLAPQWLGQLHPARQTPARATGVLAAWCILLVVVVSVLTRYRLPEFDLAGTALDLNLPQGKAPFDVITDFAMFGAISFETLGVASIFVQRRRHPRTSTLLPYRCPLYPWLPLVYVLVMAVILLNMFQSQRSEALSAVGFMLAGLVVYCLFGRRMAKVGATAD
jgi:basic amino acid/polyamine antiporter, APA family